MSTSPSLDVLAMVKIPLPSSPSVPFCPFVMVKYDSEPSEKVIV